MVAEALVKKVRINIPAHRFFLCVAPVMCLLMVWLTPPFQVADERAHFFRIYQISEGQWHAVKFEHRVGGFMPVSLLHTALAFANMPFQPQQKLNRDLWCQAWLIPLRPEERVFTDFSGAGYMSLCSYLPQAAGMRIGAIFNSPPIALLYLGRLVNAIGWCLFVYLALRLIPTASWLLTALALAPMSFFQAASLSYDATINGLSFLLLALVLRRAFAGDYGLNWKDLFIWMLLGGAIIVSKPFYAALALLVFIVPPALAGKMSHYAKAILFLAVVIAICLGPGSWRHAAANFMNYDEYNPAFRNTQAFMPGSDTTQQARYMLSHPGSFLRAGVFEAVNVVNYAGWIGILGWLDTPFPGWFYLGFGLLVLFLVATDRAPDVRIFVWQRILLVGIAALAAASVCFTLYLTFSPVGARFITGMQGRYLIPIMPLALIALHGRPVRMPAAWCYQLIPVILVAVQAITVTVILRRYYF